MFKNVNNPFRHFCIWFVTSLVTMAHFQPALAAITKPDLPDGSQPTNNFFADLKKIFKGTGEVAIYGIYIVVFVVATILIVSGANEGRKKGDWGNFWLGIFIAAVLVVAGAYFLASAEEGLNNLT